MEKRDWSEVGQGWEKDGKTAMQKRIDERINSRIEDTKPSLALEKYEGDYRGKLKLSHWRSWWGR